MTLNSTKNQYSERGARPLNDFEKHVLIASLNLMASSTARNHQKASCTRRSNSRSANSLTTGQPPYATGELPSLHPEGSIWKLGRDLADTDLLEHLIFFAR